MTQISRMKEATRQLMVALHGAREVREPSKVSTLSSLLSVNVACTLLDINTTLSTNTGAIQTLPLLKLIPVP